MSSDRMPKIDISKLKKVEADFIKFIEKTNLERVEELKRIRTNNIRTGWILGFGVLGVYAYTMLAVKQETFLDDFEAPAKVIEK